MGRSRRLPPLFELMRDTSRENAAREAASVGRAPGTAPPTPAAPAPRTTEPHVIRSIPLSVPSSRPRPETVPTPRAPSEDRAPGAWNRPLAVPVSWALVLAAAFILVFVLVWSVAYKRGVGEGRAQLRAEIDRVRGTDDGTNPPIRDGLEASRPLDEDSDQNSNTPSKTPTKTTPGVDPRQAGVRYLVAAILIQRDQADAIADFLAANGVPAAVVARGRVDPNASRANNRTSWKVIVLEGIEGDQFGKMEARRRVLEDKVETLGRKWQKERKTPYDFSKREWDQPFKP